VPIKTLTSLDLTSFTSGRKTTLSVVWASYGDRQGVYVLLLDLKCSFMSGLKDITAAPPFPAVPCLDILYNAARDKLMSQYSIDSDGHNATETYLAFMILTGHATPFFAVISRGWNRPVSVYRNGRKEGMMKPVKAMLWLSRMASNLAETWGASLDYRELYEKLESLTQPPVDSNIEFPIPEKAPA